MFWIVYLQRLTLHTLIKLKLRGVRKFILLFSVILFCSSCLKFPEDTYVKVLDVPSDFDWKTIEAKKVNIAVVSSILNDEGDTIASFLPPGEYDITVGKNTNLNIVQEQSQAETKSIKSSQVKQRVYFPSKYRYATVMFEDLFPSKGDMDMNDIVFGLNIEFFLDNKARLLGFNINIQPRAIGSSYPQIGLAANLSSDVELDIVENILHSSDPMLSPLFDVTTNSEGYYKETGVTTSDVAPITGDFRYYFYNDEDLFINVRDVDPFTYTESFTAQVIIKSTKLFPFSKMTFLDTVQTGKINLDIFACFGTRGREVHFKGQRATQKFNLLYFLSTRPKTDFSTVDNWVWAIISDKSIRHPLEWVKIYNAYPNFKIWAEGGGEIGSNWYIPSVADSLHSNSYFSYIN